MSAPTPNGAPAAATMHAELALGRSADLLNENVDAQTFTTRAATHRVVCVVGVVGASVELVRALHPHAKLGHVGHSEWYRLGAQEGDMRIT